MANGDSERRPRALADTAADSRMRAPGVVFNRRLYIGPFSCPISQAAIDQCPLAGGEANYHPAAPREVWSSYNSDCWAEHLLADLDFRRIR